MKKQWMVMLAAAAIVVGGIGYRIGVSQKAVAPLAATEHWRALEAELRGLLAQVEKERDELRAAQNLPPAPPVTARQPSTHQPPVDDAASRQALAQMIEEKTRQLSIAETALKESNAKLQEVDGRLAQLQEQQSRLTASESEWKDRLDAAAKQLAALQEERKDREARLASVEAANSEFRKRTDDSGKRLALFRQMTEEYDELAKRREAHVTTILGRYREATDLLRAMSLRLDQPREGAATMSSNDLSRIQNAISLAEEELRHLRGLNTRAVKLQQDLRAATGK